MKIAFTGQALQDLPFEGKLTTSDLTGFSKNQFIRANW
jgi:hypothetical protein